MLSFKRLPRQKVSRSSLQMSRSVARRWARFSVVISVAWPMQYSHAIAAPMCADSNIRTAAVLDRIDATGSLRLHGGSVAHLEGIRLPLGAADHAIDSFRREALAALSALTRGRLLTLGGIPPIEDRYGR